MTVKTRTESPETPTPIKIVDILVEAESYLKNSEANDTPRLDAEVLLAHALGIDRAKLIASLSETLLEKECEEYRSHIQRRANGEPLAYITGEKEFMDFMFRVNRRSLIPRPETETLVEQVIEKIRAKECGADNVLDIGTGCGCIAVSLSLLAPQAKVHATDVSEEAIKLARENAERHQVERRIHFYLGNAFSCLPESLKGKIDIIVSNPPYISDTEYTQLDKGIREYEPASALRGGGDGLDVFRLIAAGASDFLAQNGFLAVEIGSTQAEAASRIIESTRGYNSPEIIPDLAGLPRVVTCRKKL